jgi:hypothetical protein
MDVDVRLHCFRVRLENRRFLDPTYYKKPRSKFVRLGRTFVSRSPDKRATPIIGEENQALKSETLFTSRCQPREVCVISRFEASSHQDSLGHLRFW